MTFRGCAVKACVISQPNQKPEGPRITCVGKPDKFGVVDCHRTGGRSKVGNMRKLIYCQ